MTSVIVELRRHGRVEIDDERWRDLRAGVTEMAGPPRDRLAYAAAHVIMRPEYADHRNGEKRSDASEAVADLVDWPATMAFRRHVAACGLGIAEAMDTAQRFELGWPAAERLIRETGALDAAAGFVAGAGTDHLDTVAGPDDLVRGVVHQARIIQTAGGIPVILPMPWLSERGSDEATYVDVYGAIINALDGPLIVHWLGPMFLPSLMGYFPGESFERIMALDPGTVRGAKLSMLDERLEIQLRRGLVERDQIMLTGDDFHFAGLIEGGDGDDRTIVRRTRIGGREVALGDFSHALLGILDGIAAPASLALRLLDAGRVLEYRRIMTACESLSRVIFEPPTSSYKVGLAFLSWLNGHQENPMLVNRLERSRDRDHLARVVVLAAEAGALTNAPLAAERLREAGIR